MQTFQGQAMLQTRTHPPLFACRVPAGFPSPAGDYVDQPLA